MQVAGALPRRPPDRRTWCGCGCRPCGNAARKSRRAGGGPACSAGRFVGKPKRLQPATWRSEAKDWPGKSARAGNLCGGCRPGEGGVVTPTRDPWPASGRRRGPRRRGGESALPPGRRAAGGGGRDIHADRPRAADRIMRCRAGEEPGGGRSRPHGELGLGPQHLTRAGRPAAAVSAGRAAHGGETRRNIVRGASLSCLHARSRPPSSRLRAGACASGGAGRTTHPLRPTAAPTPPGAPGPCERGRTCPASARWQRPAARAVACGVRLTAPWGGAKRRGAHALQVHARVACSAVDARSAGPISCHRGAVVGTGERI